MADTTAPTVPATAVQHTTTAAAPAERRMVRSPTSVLRLLVGLAITALGMFITWRFANTMAALNRDWEQLTHVLPAWIRAIPTVIVGLTLLLVPIVVNVQLLRYRRFRLWGVVNLAAFSAFVLSEVVVGMLTTQPPSLFPKAYVDAQGAVNDPLLAGFVAAFVVGIPYLPPSTRRLATWTIGISFLTTLGFSDVPAVAWVTDLGLGVVCGAAVALLFGTPDTAPDRQELIDGLARSGIQIADIAPAAVDARGSTPWLGSTTDGRKVFVKVLNQDNRSADLMFRMFRALFLRNTGDERPTSSLRRTVEHEALLSLRATAAGIPTPELLTVSDIGNDAMLLAFVAIDGDSLDRVPDDEVTDELLDEVWRQVVDLQDHGIAHRDLRLANIFSASDGRLYLIDFGFAELAASPLLLATDLAELIGSTAPVVGVQRSVDAAERAVGPHGLARAYLRLQPYALGGATRAALKESELLEPLRVAVEDRAHIPEPDYHGTVPRSVWPAVALFGLAVATMAGIAYGVTRDEPLAGVAQWDQLGWTVFAALAVMAASTAAFVGSLRDWISLRHVVLSRLAATATDAVAPFHTGSVATRVQFLRANGIDTSSALGSVGVAVVGRVVAQVAMLYLAIRLSGRDGSIDVESDDVTVGVVALVVVAVLLLAATALLPWARRSIARSVVPPVRQWVHGFRALTGHPTRLAQLILGSVFVPLATVGCLVAAVRTMGGALDPPSVALVALAVMLVAAFLPIPGGAGVVEAGLVGGLVVFGERAAVAVPAVALFRLVSFWIPLVAGFVALRWLRRNGQLGSAAASGS
ncbi:lysylphosphatidylglycerol synthase domain-containing protein [Dermatobacter hominis]|uniref:lysylphosphatidylglycerol synthase domain-containing protein n=1 Tax=Dermatobacter hominis TaxID=2884263 RepID=UPI001D10E574|nr:lysylphosphatidylglycerol synthase domain-containing protein [Dermatobacter hominis]UDY34443.1 flippase-like domain-containing protein [Dermatobacter hominis]